jgi:hypothetical protein
MDALARGVPPTAEQYQARDLHLYRLSDADLQAEYARYTTVYLADETTDNVRVPPPLSSPLTSSPLPSSHLLSSPLLSSHLISGARDGGDDFDQARRDGR